MDVSSFADATGAPIKLWIAPGKLDPNCKIVSEKDTFGSSAGLKFPMFLDGARFRFIALDNNNHGVMSVSDNL